MRRHAHLPTATPIPPTTPKYYRPKELRLKSYAALGADIQGKLGVSFGDYTPRSTDNNWSRFLADAKNQVLIRIERVPHADGLLYLQYWKDVSPEVQYNIYNVLGVMWPDLRLFVNSWPVKVIAENLINGLNHNNANRNLLRRASENDMATLRAPVLSMLAVIQPPQLPPSPPPPLPSHTTAQPHSQPARPVPILHPVTDDFWTAHTSTTAQALQKRSEWALEKEAREFVTLPLPKLRNKFDPNRMSAERCEVLGCGRVKDVPCGKYWRTRCSTCLILGAPRVLQESSQLSPGSEPLESGARESIATAKKRALDVSIEATRSQKEATNANKILRITAKSNNTTLSQVIDDLARTPGRTEELAATKKLKFTKASLLRKATTDKKQAIAKAKGASKTPRKVKNTINTKATGKRRSGRVRVVEPEFEAESNPEADPLGRIL